MELYSEEELIKELKKEYSCGGECDHCPEVLDAGSCAVLRCIRRIIDNTSPVEYPFYAEAYQTGYEEGKNERQQDKWYEHINKSLLKARHGNHVVYNVDYLLDHLAREVYLMESVRRKKGGVE